MYFGTVDEKDDYLSQTESHDNVTSSGYGRGANKTQACVIMQAMLAHAATE